MDIVPGFPRGRAFVFVLMYLAYAAVGGAQVVATSVSVRAETGSLFWAWTGMLVVGGVVAAAGAVTRWWVPEAAAQALIAAPFILWGQAVATTDAPTRWAFVALCFAVVCGCVIRAVDVWWLARRTRETR